MAHSDLRDKAADWGLRRDVKYALAHATPKALAQLREMNIPLTRGLNRYEPKTARKLRWSFWVDARLEGLDAALEKWMWIL